MERITIPKHQHEGFKAFCELHPEDTAKILDVLKKSEPDQTTSDLASLIIKNTTIGENKVVNIIQMLESIVSASEYLSIPIQDFVEGIFLELRDILKFQYKDDSKELVLNFLMEENAFSIRNKAVGLFNSRSKKVTSTRVLTDIRPVFGDKTLELKKCLIVHNLKIGYLENGKHKEIYLAMNHETLQELKNNIIRSLDKEKLLKNEFGNKFYEDIT